MPNWCEGVMKLRGTKDNILNFLKEGFEPSYKNSAIEIDEFGEEVNIINVNYIKNTQRAFVDEQTAYIPEKEDPVVLSLKVRQAWDFAVAEFVKIAKGFNLDVHLFAWERGMEFSREVEIINGEVTKDETKKYDNWDWEVPFSNLGG